MAELRPAGMGCLAFALALQAAIVLAPAAFLGGFGLALEDPVIVAFVAATTVFCLVDVAPGLRRLAAPEATVRRAGPAMNRLAAVSGTAILVAFWAGISERLGGFLGEPWGWNVRGVGMAALLGGIALRDAAIRQLGEFFVTELRVLDGQPLETRGIYRIVRHPSELGMLGVVLGAALWLGSLAALAVFFLAVLPATVVRVRRENALLREVFGLAYEDWARRVWNLVPRVY